MVEVQGFTTQGGQDQEVGEKYREQAMLAKPQSEDILRGQRPSWKKFR
jgi:hypothetical protein